MWMLRFLNFMTAIRWGMLSLVLSLTACTGKPAVKLVIPDSRELRPAATCEWSAAMEASGCVWDQDRVTIDLGYLREIIDRLDACDKVKIWHPSQIIRS